jgi:hypothetical protein
MIGTDVRPHCLESSFFVLRRHFLDFPAQRGSSWPLAWLNQPKFHPAGGLTDASAQADLWVRSDLDISAPTQCETWNVPVLSPNSQRDVATSRQLTFHPKWGK